jgi:hypothetical protein
MGIKVRIGKPTTTEGGGGGCMEGRMNVARTEKLTRITKVLLQNCRRETRKLG